MGQTQSSLNVTKTGLALWLVCLGVLGGCAGESVQNPQGTSADAKSLSGAVPHSQQLLPILSAVKQGGWPQSEWLRATCLAFCESSGNPRAVTPNGQYVGFFQVDKSYASNEGGMGTVHKSMKTWDARGMRCSGNLFDPISNAKCGYVRLSRAGWGDWECHRKYQDRIQRCMAAHGNLISTK